ncbi:MAG TPA: HAMP domain-containing sensor histidine kinase, partial [Solirubrobacteraceae bacterium]|nr:HAMP domain-containing sensor histidine kinase [Solirubrobacteraceae bacterium]
ATVADGAERYQDGTFAGQDIRLHAVPVAEAGGPAAVGAVVVSSGTSDIEATRRRLAELIVLSALGAAALGAMVAALLTRSGLAPLRRLSGAAAAVASTGDPSRRMPDPATGDELSELAQTLNTMLGALERSQATERRLLADASHELRTPLTSLRGNLAYLVRHGIDRDVLRDLESEADRLGRLVDDLLTLEREGSAHPPHEPVALEALAREVTTRRGVELAHADAALVHGDAGALERALENLIDNAQRHGPENGIVTVALSVSGATARLAVADEGPGLGDSDREQAFERFWRGPGAHERPGSGLGLSLVRAIAERHGGTVTVRGSRFTIELPVVRAFSESGPSLGSVNEGKAPT